MPGVEWTDIPYAETPIVPFARAGSQKWPFPDGLALDDKRESSHCAAWRTSVTDEKVLLIGPRLA
jgi:hypothetical protein